MIEWAILKSTVSAFLGTPLGRWCLVIALVAAALFAGGWHERNVGWNERDQQAKHEDAARTKAEQSAIAADQAKAKIKEAKQQGDFNQLAIELQKEKDHAVQAAADRDAALRAGARLRISAGCSGGANLPGSAPDPAGSVGAATAQFLGESDSAFLLGEAARADRVVQQLNVCQSLLQIERK